jgi:hypothetical protein
MSLPSAEQTAQTQVRACTGVFCEQAVKKKNDWLGKKKKKIFFFSVFRAIPLEHCMYQCHAPSYPALSMCMPLTIRV